MKAQLANDGERLSPGQFVDISLGIETLAQAVTIPAEAVQQGPDGSFVYVVKTDQNDGLRVEVRKVTLTATQLKLAAVKDGLAAGGTTVRPADAKANSAKQ